MHKGLSKKSSKIVNFLCCIRGIFNMERDWMGKLLLRGKGLRSKEDRKAMFEYHS